MNKKTLALTEENEELNKKLTQLNGEFLDLFTRHKEMVDDEIGKHTSDSSHWLRSRMPSSA